MSPFLQHDEERKASDEKYDLYAIIVITLAILNYIESLRKYKWRALY